MDILESFEERKSKTRAWRNWQERTHDGSGVFVGDWLFVFPLRGFSLSLFCNYSRWIWTPTYTQLANERNHRTHTAHSRHHNCGTSTVTIPPSSRTRPRSCDASTATNAQLTRGQAHPGGSYKTVKGSIHTAGKRTSMHFYNYFYKYYQHALTDPMQPATPAVHWVPQPPNITTSRPGLQSERASAGIRHVRTSCCVEVVRRVDDMCWTPAFASCQEVLCVGFLHNVLYPRLYAASECLP